MLRPPTSRKDPRVEHKINRLFYGIFFTLGHTKLMFRITDFSDHFLGGEGGIKIKSIEERCAKYAKSVKKKNSILKNSNVNMLSATPIILFSEQFVNIELIHFVGNCNH